MDACMSLRSLLETVRSQRRRASLSLSSLSSSSNPSIGVTEESIHLDGKLEVHETQNKKNIYIYTIPCSFKLKLKNMTVEIAGSR